MTIFTIKNKLVINEISINTITCLFSYCYGICLKKQCPDTEVLPFKVSPYKTVQGQISTPRVLSVGHSSQLKL